MSHPYIIWTEPRTAGTALSTALRRVSEHCTLDDEPFQYGDHPQPFAHVYERWLEDRNCGFIKHLFEQQVTFKHIPESFDDGFNITLAWEAESCRYRHIKLVRCDTFAMLVSRGVAEQLGVWSRDEARERFASLDKLDPLEIDHLLTNVEINALRWEVISKVISHCLYIRSEDITSVNRQRRHEQLRRLMKFLELPDSALEILDQSLMGSGQDTKDFWHKVPNINELFSSLTERGIT